MDDEGNRASGGLKMARKISGFGPLTKKGKLTPWGFLMFMSHTFWTGTSIVEGALELDRRYGSK